MAAEYRNHPVNLPLYLARLIDEEVQDFVQQRQAEGLKAIIRYQGTSLWFITQESTATAIAIIEAARPTILQTRVQLGAFAGETGFRPDLVFIPDKMLSMFSSEKRFTPEAIRKAGIIVQSLTGYDHNNPELTLALLRNNLGTAWKTALSIPIEQVTALHL